MTDHTLKQYRLHPDVLLHESEGMTLLLNFDQGRFYALDEMAARMFKGLLDCGVEATVQEIAREFQVQSTIVAADIHHLQIDLKLSSLLAGDDRNSEKTFRSRLLTIPKIGFRKLLKQSVNRNLRRLERSSSDNSLAPQAVQKLGRLVWLTLRCYGWREALSFWLSFPLKNTMELSWELAVQQVDEHTQLAAARSLLFPMECKERALLGHFLLRFLGVESELIVGVQHAPFLAHAWVEAHGQILTDSADHCLLYEPAAAFVSNSADPMQRRSTRGPVTPLTAPVL